MSKALFWTTSVLAEGRRGNMIHILPVGRSPLQGIGRNGSCGRQNSPMSAGLQTTKNRLWHRRVLWLLLHCVADMAFDRQVCLIHNRRDVIIALHVFRYILRPWDCSCEGTSSFTNIIKLLRLVQTSSVDHVRYYSGAPIPGHASASLRLVKYETSDIWSIIARCIGARWQKCASTEWGMHLQDLSCSCLGRVNIFLGKPICEYLFINSWASTEVRVYPIRLTCGMMYNDPH